MSSLSRISSGLIYRDDFNSASGWTAGQAYSFIPSLSTYVQFDPIPTTISGTPSSSDANGIRECHLFIEGGTWYLFYGAGDGTGSGPGAPWRIQLATSTNRGITWVKQGPLDIALKKGTGGNWAARDMLYMEKRGSTYYMSAFAATNQNSGVPAEPYQSDMWTNTTIGTTGWAYQNAVVGPSTIGAVDSTDDYTGDVLKVGSTYHLFTAIVATTPKLYGVAHFTSASPLCTSLTAINQPIIAPDTTFSYENPKIFFSPTLNLYVMFVVKFLGTGTSFFNATFTSPDLTTWTPTSSADFCTMQPAALYGGGVAVNILSPSYGLEGVPNADAQGYLPCSYDFYPSSPYSNDGHIGGFIVSEPAANALDYGYYFHDPFTTESVGNLSGQNNWSQVIGAQQVQVVSSGNVNLGTNSQDDVIVNSQTSITDATITMNIVIGATSDGYGIVARYTGTNHFLMFDYAASTGVTGIITAYYKDGSGYHSLGAVSLGSGFGAGAHVLKVVIASNVYKCYLDGVLELTVTDNTSGYSGAGTCGMRNGNSGTGARTVTDFAVFDNTPETCRRSLSLTNFVAEFALEFKKTGSAGFMGFDFLAQDASNYYRLKITSGGGCVVQKVVAGTPTNLATTGGTQVTSTGVVSYLRVSVQSGVIQVTLDGELQVNVSDSTYTSGTLMGFYGDGFATYRVRTFHVRKSNVVTLNNQPVGNTMVLRTPGAGTSGLPAASTTVNGSGVATFTYPHYPMAVVTNNGVDFTPGNGDIYIWGGDVFGGSTIKGVQSITRIQSITF